jgi:RimJ/RimL family protein N-acetyltransferase
MSDRRAKAVWYLQSAEVHISAELGFLPYEWGDSPPVLDSERLRLRPLRERDVDDLFGLFADPDVMRYWSSPAFHERAQAERLIEEVRRGFASRAFVQWGIARRADDVVLGTCSLFRIEPVHRRAEIGFALRRLDWGRGIASEAVATVVQFAFGSLGLIRIEADVDPRNDRSIRLLERLGFEREGYLRSRYIVSGEIQDTVFLGLLREAWCAGR